MSRILRIRKNRQNPEKIAHRKLSKAADAILSGDKQLIKKFFGERDPFHGRRLTRAKQKTEQVMRQQGERRERIAAADLAGRESKLIKKEQS